MNEISPPVLLTPLTFLELRNALNLAIVRGRINAAERDRLWNAIETQVQAGLYQEIRLSTDEVAARARVLSDAHTPTLATRSLDLLHVAAALLCGASDLLTFDERQRRAAQAEGLRTLPET